MSLQAKALVQPTWHSSRMFNVILLTMKYLNKHEVQNLHECCWRLFRMKRVIVFAVICLAPHEPSYQSVYFVDGSHEE
jgi:hypothetical protein